MEKKAHEKIRTQQFYNSLFKCSSTCWLSSPRSSSLRTSISDFQVGGRGLLPESHRLIRPSNSPCAVDLLGYHDWLTVAGSGVILAAVASCWFILRTLITGTSAASNLYKALTLNRLSGYEDTA